jgi:hypothetical protein
MKNYTHWPKATNFPETATYAIDFGPGGLRQISSADDVWKYLIG